VVIEHACPHFAEGINYDDDSKSECVFCQRPAGQSESREWLTVLDAYNRGRIHVVPLNDVILHRTVRDQCVCGPRREGDNRHPIYVHHSLDGREVHES
jgi:hypothetical protein